MKRYLALFSSLLFGACLYAESAAAAEEELPVPSAAQSSDHFDPLAATNAYLATVPPDKKARSGTVRWVNLTENYWVRARPEQILEAAKAIQ